MKKITFFLTAVMLATLLCACQDVEQIDTSVITSEQQGAERYFVAQVVNTNEGSLLVEIINEGTSYISLGNQAWISSPKESNVSYAGYAEGDYVRVTFDGLVMETYPLQINSVTSISLTDKMGMTISEK